MIHWLVGLVVFMVVVGAIGIVWAIKDDVTMPRKR